MINYSREGWRPDPDGVHQYRYHDGRNWTDLVGNDGVESRAPRGAGAPPGPGTEGSSPADAEAASPAGADPVAPTSSADGERAGRMARQYGAACVEVLSAAQAALDVANDAHGAWNAAQIRPQHEISIRHFTDAFREKEVELGHRVGVLRRAVAHARNAAAELWACEGLVDPEMWLLVCLEDDVYGQVGVAIEFLRIEIGSGVQGFLDTISAVNDAASRHPNYGEPGFLGFLYGQPPLGRTGGPGDGTRNPNAF